MGASGAELPPVLVRRRRRFLVVSALVVVAVLVAAREVLTPFVIALVVAYVLTPVVARFERRGVRRPLAIVLTYAAALLSLGAATALVAPRVARDVGELRHEVPALRRQFRDRWEPKLDAFFRHFADKHEGHEPPVADAEGDHAAALRVVPHDDGSYDVRLGSGVDIRPIGDGGYRVEQATPSNASTGFDLEGLLSRAFGEAVAYGRSNFVTIVRVVQAAAVTAGRGIFYLFLTLMLAAYTMLTREAIYDFFRSLCAPSARPSFDSLAARVDIGLAGVVRGQLVICLINGVLSAIGFGLLRLHYWPILALLAAVLSLIPIFGALLSSIPAVALALLDSPATALATLVWVVIIHQVEANVLNPKILGDSAHIHPVLVVFSLLAGEHLFHLVGALLAVPCLSVAQSLFLHFRALSEGRPPAADVAATAPD